MESYSNIGEYLPKYDVYIQYLPFPESVDGSIASVRCEPVILINMSRGDWEKLIAIWHEILHLLRGDLYQDGNILDLEDIKYHFATLLQKQQE